MDHGIVGVWWQANTEPDLAGYFVYVVEDGVTRSAVTDPIASNYLLVDVGTTGSIEVYVTAIDFTGNESSPSNSRRPSAQIIDPNRDFLGGDQPMDY